MLDHIGINVTHFDAARKFYVGALQPLGIEPLLEFPKVCGFGDADKPYLWIAERGEPSAPVHVALASPDRATVDAFHAAAAAGGRDNGEAGPRPIYHAGYYGAFVLDPDGNNIEAVCHRPEG